MGFIFKYLIIGLILGVAILLMLMKFVESVVLH